MLFNAAGELETALNMFGVVPNALSICSSKGWLAAGLVSLFMLTRGIS